MSSTTKTPVEQSGPIVIRADDLERLENLLATTGRWRDGGPLQDLQDEIERAQVVAPEQLPPDVVAMNSCVRFVDERSGVEESLTLVYPVDADAALGRVSVLAPVGSALLGLRVGQRIEWVMPNGDTRQLRVVAVG